MTPHDHTSLDDCPARLREGLPIITCHKPGPRPRGVRLKGRYVGEALFRRQLAEWTDAGIRSAPVDQVGVPAGNPAAKVVLTFEDGFENVLRHGLVPLREHGFTARDASRNWKNFFQALRRLVGRDSLR